MKVEAAIVSVEMGIRTCLRANVPVILSRCIERVLVEYSPCVLAVGVRANRRDAQRETCLYISHRGRLQPRLERGHAGERKGYD